MESVRFSDFPTIIWRTVTFGIKSLKTHLGTQ